MQKMHEIFQEIWQSITSSRREISDIKSRLPNNNMTDTDVKEQWYRLYCSYSPGLFRYYEFPVPIRTNSIMEQHFIQEKFKFIQQCGKPNVGRQIRIRGDYVLKMQYVDHLEIKTYLDLLPGSYSHDDVYKHLRILHERQTKESQRWQSNIGGINALRALFDKEDK
jgi:hypothetical protein